MTFLRKAALSLFIMCCVLLPLLNLRYSTFYVEQEHQKKLLKPSTVTNYSTSINKRAPTQQENSYNQGMTLLFRYGRQNVNITIQRLLQLRNLENSKKNKKVSVPLYPEDSLETDRILEQMKFIPKKLRERPVIIYLASRIQMGDVQKDFEKANCPVQNCMFSQNVDKVGADAILFRQSINPSVVKPEDRRPDQIWIFYALESPTNVGDYKYDADNLINWTATYRWDSDLVTPYERFTLNEHIPPDQKPNSLPAEMSKFQNFAQQKTKKVAWFASNCVTNNRREIYVEELSKYISVDTYGECGKKKCPRTESRCGQMLDSDYKFYIAFENSNCQDYMTEKYFRNGLGHNTIPIVMGARTEEYEQVSPKHSFIHVDNFKSPKDLASYLNYLDGNDTAYNEYFAWKGSGQYINTKFFCRLCAMLNDPKPKVYQSLKDWWLNGRCTTGRW